jgi:hypothetical protein
VTVPALELAKPTTGLKLDLGGGQAPAPGFDCVDLLAPNAKYKVDLFKFPWPFEDDSVDEIHCSHLIEHIPSREVTREDIVVSDDRKQVGAILNAAELEYVGKDMLFAFFDECWRIMKHDAWMTLAWPALRSNRAFQDPTHRRFIPLETIQYMSRDWRKAQGLDHYRVKCHFGGDLQYVADSEIGTLHPKAAEKWITRYWNTMVDFQAKMKAVKL